MGTVKLQFTQGGATVEYTLDQDVTIKIQGLPPEDSKNTLTLNNATLTFAGDAPWAGTKMTVNIGQLNVRHDTSTKQDPAGKVTQGQELVVGNDTTTTGKIVWRQIIKPDDLAGKWTAERVGDEVYLVPSSEYVPPEPVSETFTAASVEAKPLAEAQSAPNVDRSGSDPAPLTGRFQLVKRKGPHGTYTALAIDGDSTPKMGVNVREMAYFGTPQWQWTNEKWLATYAQTAKDLGMKWVRFFAAHREYSTDQIIARTKKVLDILAEKDLLGVVCFADSLAEKGMFPKGDEPWHTGSRDHYIKDYFNDGHYRQNYLPLVKAMVSALKDHKGLGMWQLMNELAIYNPPANDNDVKGFAGFVDEVSEAIYTIDSAHPISIGIINTAHIMPPGKDVRQFSRDFYSKRKFIHAASSHCYQFDNNTNPSAAWEHEDFCAIDGEVADDLGRAMFWTEFGAANGGDRRASSERFLAQHFVKGPASAALQWGFMLDLDGIPDSGVGDGRYGFSRTINNAYDQLADLFKSIVRGA